MAIRDRKTLGGAGAARRRRMRKMWLRDATAITILVIVAGMVLGAGACL